jgi:hypothetical protein
LDKTALFSPALLQITDAKGNTYYGCDQEWFTTVWQRKAGCGPSTAANVFLYLLRRGRLSLPYEIRDKADFIRLMEEAWEYITPGQQGVHRSEQWAKGAEGFLRKYGAKDHCVRMDIPAVKAQRRDFAGFVRFIQEGLLSDCPVAFLNLSNGKLKNLDNWHWVTITGIFYEEGVFADVCDAGKEFSLDLSLWYETTALGGALAYLRR